MGSNEFVDVGQVIYANEHKEEENSEKKMAYLVTISENRDLLVLEWEASLFGISGTSIYRRNIEFGMGAVAFNCIASNVQGHIIISYLVAASGQSFDYYKVHEVVSTIICN